MAFLFSKAADYNDFIAQVRGFMQGHPQVKKTDDKDPQSGIAITGSGDGELYVSTESYTPAAAATSPLGTLYRLTCTTGGGSGVAEFDVEQVEGVSPGFLGVLTAGERFAPDGDDPQYTGSPLGSPGLVTSPLHGLRLFLQTTTTWVASDTVEFRLVQHDVDGNAIYNWEEQRYTQTGEDGNGNFEAEWIARAPTVSGASASPVSTVFYGMKSTFSVAQNYYNVAVLGMDGYNPSSVFASQPNACSPRYIYLDDTPFSFFLMCNGSGLWACARVGAVYQHCTMQQIDVFATGNQHPKPTYIGAQGELGTLTFTESDNDRNAAPFDPGNESSGQFRWTDGTWYDVENRTDAYSKATDRDSVPVFWIGPFRANWGTASWDNGIVAGELNASVIEWTNAINQMLPRYDGTYELLPVTLFTSSPQDAAIGDLAFIKAVTGQGLNPEDTTTDTSQSPNKEYLALQNTNLSARDNFIVMEIN